MARADPDCFLILMADQLAASWLPIYGHALVDAPHLTGLARQATVFDSAYCPYPLCAPSRAAMLTGRYASSVEVYDNAAELRAGMPTVAHVLRSAGYHTAVAGKMHFVGPDQLHGFEERLTTDIYPADVDWTPDWNRPLDRPLPWYHTMESVLRPGICPASMQTDYDDEVSFHAVRKLHEIARHRGAQPFLLLVSFTHPHDPWEIPRRYWERYRPEQIDPPAVPAIPLEQADPHSRRLRAMCRVDEAGLTVEQIRHARHGYYAAISYLDDRVGEVLGALRDSGLQDRTTVLFCTDHGELLGERGLWYKMSFLEPSARVPLIVRRPGGAGHRVREPVSLVDIAPTLLELAGLGGLTGDGMGGRSGEGTVGFAGDGAEGSSGEGRVGLAGERTVGLAGERTVGLAGDGVSLAGVVQGTGPAPSHPVISEYHAEGVQAPSAMLRAGHHKLIVSPQDPDLLYDLQADPRELHNLAGAGAASEALVAKLRATLDARLDLQDIDRRVRISQHERRLVSSALRQGRYTPWDYQPPVDAAMQYVRNREDLYELQRRERLDEPG